MNTYSENKQTKDREAATWVDRR